MRSLVGEISAEDIIVSLSMLSLLVQPVVFFYLIYRWDGNKLLFVLLSLPYFGILATLVHHDYFDMSRLELKRLFQNYGIDIGIVQLVLFLVYALKNILLTVKSNAFWGIKYLNLVLFLPVTVGIFLVLFLLSK